MTTEDELSPELPEYRDNPFISRLPPVLSAEQALSELIDLPFHREGEQQYPPHLRCHCILRLGRYFDPLERQLQLEMRMSALIRQGYVGRNPHTTDYLHRLHNDYERVARRDLDASLYPVESTASGFALIGCSGIGKSRSVERILRLYPQTIHHVEPFSLMQVTWLKLDCPYKGSAKQLCIGFFHEMDKILHTRFEARFGSSRHSVDEMVVHMAEVADRHALGVLVIDEIQHLVQAPGLGCNDLLNFLVTLVNKIGIPVMIVGTPTALPLLQGAFRQARRASGLGSLVWERMPNDASWDHFVARMWRYQWTRDPTPLTDELREVLYEESQGVVDIVVKLFMLAQLHAIQLGVLRGRAERLEAGLLRHVARENFRLIAPMIDALKRNDVLRLSTFGDLVPLQDYVRQAFQNATVRLAPSAAPLEPAEHAAAAAVDGGEAILVALEGLGLARDLAEVLLTQARLENPGLGPLALVAAISEKLRERGAEASPTKQRPGRARRATPRIAPLDPDDMRTIVSAASAAGATAYAALLAAGVVKPPLMDVAA
ncbi:MAG: ATP-binding protein [Methylocystaceae bacterium]|nr:MAG: ATP-binding protein [Methylocystaceae bacterium]